MFDIMHMAVAGAISTAAAIAIATPLPTSPPGLAIGPTCHLERIGTQYLHCDDLVVPDSRGSHWVLEVP